MRRAPPSRLDDVALSALKADSDEGGCLILANRLSELVRAGDWLADQALPEAVLFAVRLCVEEAFTNIVSYAFDGGDHDITLEIHPLPSEVEVVLSDDGRPFDPLAVEASSAATLETASIGGRGILLIKKFTARQSYLRQGGLNVLTLGFAV